MVNLTKTKQNMASIEDLYNVKSGDIMCSIWNKNDKKWVRVLQDNEGNNVCIHKLEVERSLNGSKNWILCLYKQDSTNNNEKYVFHLDIDTIKAKIWKK